MLVGGIIYKERVLVSGWRNGDYNMLDLWER